MAGRPRRTAEIPTSSVKKAPQASARKSRIVQPQFHARTTSMERVSMAPGSAMKSRGITPLRQPPQTPQTPTFTPMSRTKLTMTAEKEDRAVMCAFQKRILDYLAETNAFSDIKQLRAMTFKNFAAIVAHLLQKLGDKRYNVEGNSVDDIYKAVMDLEYPYTINKSWLKTPTAGHAFHHVVIMLHWLVELIDSDASDALEFIQDTDFPNAEYQGEFFHKINVGFRLWDQRKDEEFEQLKEELIDQFLRETAQVSSKQILMENMTTMRDERERLAVEVKPSDDLEQRADLEMKVQTYIREIQALELAIQQLNEEKTALRKSLAENVETLKARVAESNALKNQVRKQKMTVDEKTRIIDENFKLKSIIAEQEKQINRYEDTDSPLTVSRLLKEKCQRITELNRIVFEVAKLLPNIDPAVYHVNPKSENLQSDLNIIENTFKTFTTDLDAVTATKSTEKVQQLQKKFQLETKLTDKMRLLEEMQGKVARNEGKLSERMEKILIEIEELNTEERKLKQKVEVLTGETTESRVGIERNGKDLKQIQAETQVLMEKFLREAREVRQQKKKSITDVDQLLEEAKVEQEYLKAQKQMYTETLRKLKF